jgi:hypothetical protein
MSWHAYILACPYLTFSCPDILLSSNSFPPSHTHQSTCCLCAGWLQFVAKVNLILQVIWLVCWFLCCELFPRTFLSLQKVAVRFLQINHKRSILLLAFYPRLSQTVAQLLWLEFGPLYSWINDGSTWGSFISSVLNPSGLPDIGGLDIKDLVVKIRNTRVSVYEMAMNSIIKILSSEHFIYFIINCFKPLLLKYFLVNHQNY